MPYTDDWSVAEGKTVLAVEQFTKRVVIRLSDGVEIDIRPEVEGNPLSVGVHVPEVEVGLTLNFPQGEMEKLMMAAVAGDQSLAEWAKAVLLSASHE
jgi:hypothetical protein